MAREVNEELNLTPFIGLFAMLVVILLLTAVWNQIEALSTNSSSTTASDDTPPPEDEKKKVQLSVTILGDKLQLAEDVTPTDIPNLGEDLNIESFIFELEKLREKFPERKDIILNTDNKTPYKHLIQVFDTLVGNGWVDVGVSTQ